MHLLVELKISGAHFRNEIRGGTDFIKNNTNLALTEEIFFLLLCGTNRSTKYYKACTYAYTA